MICYLVFPWVAAITVKLDESRPASVQFILVGPDEPPSGTLTVESKVAQDKEQPGLQGEANGKLER